MAYEVLARKWRPKHFCDVIGQEHVTKTLQNAIASKRVAHAYLFVGPRGIGKTTLSRIFAKALNCSAGDDATADPCDNCTNCKEIMAGTSLDVIEIDAASNNGVNNIRDIREDAQFAPTSSRYKVFIIDEVHMLSTGAFNALLKTLEEPPPHVKFIFATTEIDKLPATIISRCQRFDLRRIPTGLIVKSLSKICEAEGVTASEDALLAIARGAEGGMRDALSALDQIISFKGTNVTEDDVLSVFGLVSREQIVRLTTSMLKGDMALGLKIVNDLDARGKDLRRLLLEMLNHFRDLLVLQQLGAEATTILDVTPEQLKSLQEQAPLVDSKRILRVIENFADLENKMRYTLSRRTIFETALLRSCRAVKTVSLDSVIQALAKAKLGFKTDNEGLENNSDEGERVPEVKPAVMPNPSTSRQTHDTGLGTLKSALERKAAIPPVPPAPISTPKPPESIQIEASIATPPVDAATPIQIEEQADGDADDDNPIRAAHEVAIKAALKLFRGHIIEIRQPLKTVEADPIGDSDEDNFEDYNSDDDGEFV